MMWSPICVGIRQVICTVEVFPARCRWRSVAIAFRQVARMAIRRCKTIARFCTKWICHARPDFADGCRFDDAALGIKWPLPVTVVAKKDLEWPPLRTAAG